MFLTRFCIVEQGKATGYESSYNEFTEMSTSCIIYGVVSPVMLSPLNQCYINILREQLRITVSCIL